MMNDQMMKGQMEEDDDQDFFFEMIETEPATVEGTSLYLCFREQIDDESVALMIQAMDLTDLLKTKGGVTPSQVAYKVLKKEDGGHKFGCGVYDCKIFFTGGAGKKEMFYFDPMHPSQHLELMRGPKSHKVEPFVSEMEKTEDEKKLYVLSRVPTRGSNFEVFNSRTGKWKSLPDPPYKKIGRVFCPVSDGKDIYLLGRRNDLYFSHFSSSKRKWTTEKGDPVFFSFGPPALIVRDSTTNCKILFTYDVSPKCVSLDGDLAGLGGGSVDAVISIGSWVFSTDADTGSESFHMLNTLNFGRGVPPELIGSHYQLVHGQDRHIFLILYSYSPPIPDHQLSHLRKGRMKVCIIHLEYYFKPEEFLLGESLFILSRRGDPYFLEYPYDHNLVKKHVCMIGAFMLPTVNGNTEEAGEDGLAHDDAQKQRGSAGCCKVKRPKSSHGSSGTKSEKLC